MRNGLGISALMSWGADALVLLLSVATLAAADGTTLVQAAKDQKKETVRSLVQQGVDVNAAPGDGTTALAWATHWNDLETVDLLIRSGADVNRANEYGYSPLLLACSNSNAAVVERLLRAGANPKAALWTGETALMTCVRAETLEGVKALLARGADPNTREPERGQTSLMWAAARRNPAIVKALVESGADIHARSRPTELYSPMVSTVYAKNVYWPKTRGGFTPLMFAAQAGDLESVRILVEAGARVNEISPSDGTALVLAASNGHEDVGLYLLEKGANPNASDAYGVTALHWSLQMGLVALYTMPRDTDRFWDFRDSPELAKRLLARGADSNARIAKDFMPYDIHRFAHTLLNDLPQVGLAGATPFLLAAAAGDATMMRVLLEKKADPTITTLDGLTALMAAAGVGRERGRGAVRPGYQDAARLAVQLGNDVNAVGPGGRRAVHGATYIGDTEMLKFLAEQGAHLEAKNKYGETPMSIALGDPGGFTYKPLPGNETDDTWREPKPQKQIVDLLLQLGAAPYSGLVADKSGR